MHVISGTGSQAGLDPVTHLMRGMEGGGGDRTRKPPVERDAALTKKKKKFG